jgi:putative transposase
VSPSPAAEIEGIRNTESYAQKWDYVRENPVRAGLVSTAEKWKYQGEIVEIDHA